MMGIMNTVAATVIAANAGVADVPATGIVTQVDLSGDFISTCDTGFELGPHDQLQPGEKVWVREPDISTDPSRHSACTADDNLYPADEPRKEVCTVGENGLDVGPDPFGNFGEAVILGRAQDGTCYIVPNLSV